jgi:hypothetical protein
MAEKDGSGNLARGGSTVPYCPEVKGLSPAPDTGNKRKKLTKRSLSKFL